jgi:hypothetical protein
LKNTVCVFFFGAYIHNSVFLSLMTNKQTLSVSKAKRPRTRAKLQPLSPMRPEQTARACNRFLTSRALLKDRFT